MKYSIEKLSQQEVFDLLVTCNNSFTPPLSKNIPYTLEEYAERLATYADFVLVKEFGNIAGFLAYYTNTEGGFVYIPQIWVSDEYQRRGIGANMMEKLINYAPSYIKKIRLEVRRNNVKAVNFYKKSGFVLIEEENNKYLLEKDIS